ncbi:OmpA family protein [Mariniflexile sp.]|uniref:OmpA family protein n=1 Tax=Mariniflexile sp. TaxID=1979402 RepID=UPI0035694889
MKITCMIASLLLIVNTSYAQNKKTEKADMLFKGYQYIDAIDAYLELVENNNADNYVYKQLGDSYYNVFNTAQAVKWYNKAVGTKQDAEVYFKYAQALKSLGKYEEANKQMDVFAKMKPNDQRAKDHIADPNYLPRLVDKQKLFDVEPIAISSKEQSDFGIVLTNDNMLYFASSRNTSGKQDSWNHQPYLDIYKSKRNDNGTFSEPEAVEELNTPYHDGPLTISADGKTMIFARDGQSGGAYKKDKNNKVKIAQQGLYSANLVDGKWTNVQPLPFNSNEYSVSHPSLSTDGKTLYFASNMPGGLGDTDIWKVSVNNGSYGVPKNLGNAVNSPGKEGFPFISDNTILYYSSTGKQGLGGYDVFKIDLKNDNTPINLGKPINTKSDDFSFSMNTLKNVAFFASNREGIDNIYSAIPVCSLELIAHTTDAKTNAILSAASVSILDESNNIIATKQTDSNGLVSFDAECHTNYVFNVAMKGYETKSFAVEKSIGGSVKVEAALSPIDVIITDKEVLLKNIYFEFDKSNITQQGAFELDKLVHVMNDYPEMVIFVKSHTDNKGSQSHNLKLSEQRAQSTVQYLISKGINKTRLSGKGMGSSEPKVDCKSNCTEEQDAQNRRSEFLIVKK